MATRLRELRKSLGLTQSELAEALKTTKSYISRLETGERELSIRMLEALQHQYHVRQKWLLTGEGEMFEKASEEQTEAVYQALMSMTDEQWAFLKERLKNAEKK